jgi:large subunit ribosomal protein L32e
MDKQHFIKEITKIRGIGAVKAEALYKKGYVSIDIIKDAKIEDLIKIEGITKINAENIITEYTKKETIIKPSKQKTSKEIEDEKIKEEKTTELTDEKKEEVYKVNRKPQLSKELEKILKKRKTIKKRTPKFLREEWFRYKRISHNWRRPDGITSKMRTNLKYRPNKVRIGYRGPRQVRNLHSSGFEEIMVYNLNDLNSINPKTQAARIGSTVGTRKRKDIEKKADELEIRILNL